MTSHTTNKTTNSDYKSPNVFLYVANIMDYFRLITTALSFYYAKTNPILFITLYFSSFALDAFDGMVARAMSQASRYGGTLDMVIDRISTSGLLMVLSNFYTEYSHFFIFLMMLDIGSHWLQTNSGFMDPDQGAQKNINHKSLEEKFWILNFYYKTKFGLLVVCLGAEIFLLMLYFLHFNKELINQDWFYSTLIVNFAIYALKQIISVIQAFSASQRIVRYDQYEHRLKWENQHK
jgi:CDP-diacylglycerol--inositol 3-phosphatidyltransferase